MESQSIANQAVEINVLTSYEGGISDVVIEELHAVDDEGPCWPEGDSERVISKLVDHPAVDAEQLRTLIAKPHCLCVSDESMVSDYGYISCDELFARGEMQVVRL